MTIGGAEGRGKGIMDSRAQGGVGRMGGREGIEFRGEREMWRWGGRLDCGEEKRTEMRGAKRVRKERE